MKQPSPKTSKVTSSRVRSAVSIVELLCVLAAISLMLSILLPAIQAARETGRRTACQSNLRNIALAMIQLNDTQRRLPENRFRFDANGTCISESLWFDKVRPYLELPPVASGTGNIGPGKYGPYSILSCPSSPPAVLLEPIASSLNGPVADSVAIATSDYVASAGVNSVLTLGQTFPAFAQRAGLVADVFDPQRFRNEQEIRAGRTYTLAAWETSGSQRRKHISGWPRPVYRDWREDTSRHRLRSDLDISQDVAVDSTASQLRYFASSAGMMRGYIGFVSTLWQPLRDPASEQPASPHVVNTTNTYHGPYTFHATTFSASFFDGSARPISLTIDPLILMHLATVTDDGEPATEDTSILP